MAGPGRPPSIFTPILSELRTRAKDDELKSAVPIGGKNPEAAAEYWLDMHGKMQRWTEARQDEGLPVGWDSDVLSAAFLAFSSTNADEIRDRLLDVAEAAIAAAADLGRS